MLFHMLPLFFYTDVDGPQAPFVCLCFKDIMQQGQNRSSIEERSGSCPSLSYTKYTKDYAQDTYAFSLTISNGESQRVFF
jgi:hypothetical protein